MSVQTLDPRRDVGEDEMRLPYPLTGQADAEVRVPHGAMVQGEAWVKARIGAWFRYHDEPQSGTSVRIPDYQFDAKRFQPEG